MSVPSVSPPLADLPPLREVIRAHGLSPDKRLGQHFLLDPSILARIARAAEPLQGRVVLEVGPGPGGLTRALLATEAARIVAVEADERCVEALRALEVAAHGRLELVQADALLFDPAPLAAEAPLKVVANLPYNVGTELLVRWLQRPALFEAFVLMFQREVAQRLVARPGTDEYGRLAVLAQSLCAVERLYDLPAAAFVPPPKVVSSVVRLFPKAERPDPATVARLEQVTKAAFGQRRKMLRSSLKALGVDADALLARAGIEPTRRAETLSLAEFLALAEALPSIPC